MKSLAAVSIATAHILGLMTYEVATLAVAVVALVLAVASLLQGNDNRRDIRALVDLQKDRADRLVAGLEGDVANGEER